MPRIAYVDGRYVPHAEAGVHIEDRGFQFADGVYEYFAVFGGKLADLEGHMERLWRSLSELRIDRPMSQQALVMVMHETIRRNRFRDGAVYLQVTRGVALRDHPIPNPAPRPTVVVTAKPVDFAAVEVRARKGIKVLTQPDIRWGRCDIKTVGLLPNCLAKTAAREAGAYEAWLVDELGFVTEGSSTNAWIVDADGVLRTRDTNANILRGVTRKTLITLAAEAGIEVSQRPFTVAEAKAAKEAFITAASTFVMPVVGIDEAIVGNGRPGPISERLRVLYVENARATAR
ncbi:D-amino-acid transaminase [Phenylobacterium montanum]|uniref:Probable branched-chain-amino-acid aminotransferase n=1 Tax=Phenylobacterium montanum TaxID=2823693 RepID=A0A975G183_9CAUL|nr:D-amino-acid transaminase [Caulobacter sp. S6]QUD88881.1 D-amino-acid transaminase [Caulobacter sp. S6]